MAKNKTNANSDSEQAGSATRGSEAGSASEVTATSAGAGTSDAGAGAQHKSAGAEVTSDIGQAEKYIELLSRQGALSQDLRTFTNGSLARVTALLEVNVADSIDASGRRKQNSASHDSDMNSVNQSSRESSLQVVSKTNTIDIASLVSLLQGGVTLSCPKGGK